MRDYNSRIMRDRTSRRNNRMRDRESHREFRDMRNPYGSRGGYVNYRRDRENGNNYNYDMNYQNDYNYMDYDAEESKETYKEDLKKWTKKLKKKDRFGMSEDDIINQARQTGVDFEDFSEDEFLAIYYMLVSDFKQVSNAPQTYLVMAKEWLEDGDIAVSPGEKICIYMYDIVMGE